MFLGCSLGTREIRRHQNILSDPESDLPQVHEWSLQLGENLVSRLISEPLLKVAIPAGVEVVINQQGSRHIVHLLNNMMDPVLFCDNRSGLLSLADISINLNQNRIGSVRDAVTGSGVRLSVKHDGKWAGMTLPKLGVHEMIVVEHS